MNYLLRILIAIDQLLNVVVCDGQPDETMSSVAWRMEREGRFWGFMRPVIDAIFNFWGPEHCREAYESEVRRLQSPVEQRQT